MKNGIVRTIIGFILFFVYNSLHNREWLSVTKTVQMGSYIQLVAAIYFLFFLLWNKRFFYDSSYKPPFTMFYIFGHVYGLGIFIFVVMYCCLNANVYVSSVWVSSMICIVSMDMYEKKDKNWKIIFCKTVTILMIIIIQIYYIVMSENHSDFYAMWSDWNFFEMAFVMVLPWFVPFMFLFFRTQKYCTSIKDVTVDLMQYGLPFSTLIAIFLTISLNRCSYESSNINMWQNISTESEFGVSLDWYQIFLMPLVSVLLVFFVLFSIITQNTIESVITFTLSAASRNIMIHTEDTVAVFSFMMSMIVLLFWNLNLYFLHISEDKIRLVPLSDEDSENTPV